MRLLILASMLAGACSGFKALDKNDLGGSGVADMGSGVGGNGGAGGDGGGGGTNGGNKGDGGTTDTGDGDGGTTPATGAIPCGNTFCRSDETCSNGACSFPCSGTRVPGDYATIQAAVDVLENAAGPSTICLGAQAYHENVDIGLATATTLSLLGVSPGQTSIDSVVVTQGDASNTINLRGFTTATLDATAAGSPSTSAQWNLNVTRLAVSGPASFALTSQQDGLYGPSIDGVDFAGGLTVTVTVATVGGSQLSAIVANSYIHGGSDCVHVEDTANNFAFTTGTLTLVNDTIVGCQNGIAYGYSSQGATATLQLTYENDIIANHSMTGVSIANPPSTVLAQNNALYGNGSNFAGVSEGSNDVKSDCLLDGETPPVPGSGSPCRGAGLSSVAPAHDYWGAPRSTTADIGAVQTQ